MRKSNGKDFVDANCASIVMRIVGPGQLGIKINELGA
jgi:hypothetical protein